MTSKICDLSVISHRHVVCHNECNVVTGRVCPLWLRNLFLVPSVYGRKKVVRDIEESKGLFLVYEFL